MTDSLIRPRPRRWGWLILTCAITAVWSFIAAILGVNAFQPETNVYNNIAYIVAYLGVGLVFVGAVMTGLHNLLFLGSKAAELLGRHSLIIFGTSLLGATPAIGLGIIMATSAPDVAKLEAITQDLVTQAQAESAEFDLRSEALLGGDVLAPTTLMTQSGITQARKNITAQREIYRERETALHTYIERSRAAILDADISPTSSGYALAQFDMETRHLSAQMSMAIQKLQDALDEWEAALDLLALRPRRWVAQDDQFMFYNDTDLAAFDAHMKRVDALRAEAEAIGADPQPPAPAR